MNLPDKERVRAMLFESKGLLTPTAKKLGISLRALNRMLDEDDDLARAREEAQERVGDELEAQLIARANSGDVAALTFMLKTKFGARGYKEKVEVNSTNLNLNGTVSPLEMARLCQAHRAMKQGGKSECLTILSNPSAALPPPSDSAMTTSPCSPPAVDSPADLSSNPIPSTACPSDPGPFGPCGTTPAPLVLPPSPPSEPTAASTDGCGSSTESTSCSAGAPAPNSAPRKPSPKSSDFPSRSASALKKHGRQNRLPGELVDRSAAVLDMEW